MGVLVVWVTCRVLLGQLVVGKEALVLGLRFDRQLLTPKP